MNKMNKKRETSSLKNPKIKPIIYQILPRVGVNMNPTCRPDGSLEQNGCGRLNDVSPAFLSSLKQLGVTAVWYTGLIEHATKSDFPGIPADNPFVVKGEAGSPYAIKDYYDIAPSLASQPSRRMREFEDLVERTHAAGLSVVIDFVPNHTARVYHSDVAPDGVDDFGANDDTSAFCAPDNNYYYITGCEFAPTIDLGHGDGRYREFPAKATGNDCFRPDCGEYDWYETVKLNYGHDYFTGVNHYDPVPDTWKKMLDILLFWCGKGIDAFRCDMVFMVPREFWHWATARVKEKYPDVAFIGEIYDVNIYRDFLGYCGFDYLYDKVNLYDRLVDIERHGVAASDLTRCWQAVDGIGDSMLNFLENHDEVRYASSEFAGRPDTVVPHLVVSSMISKGPFMIYYGQELGEPACENEGFAGYNHRTTIFDYWSLERMRNWCNGGAWDGGALSPDQLALRAKYARVLRLCNSCEAIREGGFFDLTYCNLENPAVDTFRIFAFLRHSQGQILLIVANFGHEPADPAIFLPSEAFINCNLPEGRVKAVNLLDNKELQLTISPDYLSSPLHVGPRDALILQLKPVK